MAALEVVPEMETTYEPPRSLSPAHTHYCPGCTHGTIQRLAHYGRPSLAYAPHSASAPTIRTLI